MAGKKDDLRKGNFKFNIVEDKELLVHAGLVVPIAQWSPEGNSLNTKTEIDDSWVNGIMMIVITYS
jgi:hypothetical protein